MIPPNVFIPKDRNEALFVITHELMHQLERMRSDFDQKVANSNPNTGCEKQQIQFLEDLIDAIERS
jgi:hypothetical protein